MTVLARRESLERRHAAIQAALYDELSHPFQDEQRIRELKHEKVRVKDEMTQLIETRH